MNKVIAGGAARTHQERRRTRVTHEAVHLLFNQMQAAATIWSSTGLILNTYMM